MAEDKPMSPEDLARKMDIILKGERATFRDCPGPHFDHIAADELLCDALRSLGYSEAVEIYESIQKWYS